MVESLLSFLILTVIFRFGIQCNPIDMRSMFIIVQLGEVSVQTQKGGGK